MRIAIITDSNSGITKADAARLGVTVVPMPFMIDGEEYFEDVNLTQDEFYNLILNDANVSTSQPSLGVVSDFFDKALLENDKVIYIPMSSGLSMSCKSAINLAKSPKYLGKVYVVDNLRISVTMYRAVEDACTLRSEGYEAEEIYNILMKNRDYTSIYIMVNTLKYLRKGGRITPAVALMGSLLKIKPILQIHGDKLDKFKQTRTVGNAKRIMLDKAKEDISNLLAVDGKTDNVRIDVAHTMNYEEALKFAEEVKAEFGVTDVLVHPLSLSVACHIGPGALAIAMTKELIK